MALTMKSLAYNHVGQQYMVTGTTDFDSSYPTGGEALTAGLLGLGVLDFFQAYPSNQIVFQWDKTNAKLLAIAPTGGAAPATLAAPSTAVPSGATAVTSTAAQPNLTETGGQGVEFAAATDLSTVTGVHFVGYGVG